MSEFKSNQYVAIDLRDMIGGSIGLMKDALEYARHGARGPEHAAEYTVAVARIRTVLRAMKSLLPLDPPLAAQAKRDEKHLDQLLDWRVEGAMAEFSESH